MQAFGTAIFQYHTMKNKFPASTTELKGWLTSLKPDKLKGMGIDNVDKAFVSPRDGEPYVYVKPARFESTVYAHEKTGQGGKKLAVGYDNFPEMLTDDELQRRLKADKTSGT